MSRTIRRKNDKWEYEWVCYDWDSHPGFGVLRKSRLPEPKLSEEIKRFHADKPSGYHNAPASFRRCLNRTRKAKEKAVVRKLCSGQIDFDEYIINSRRKEANWLWW